MKDTSRILDLKYKLQTIELLNLAKTEYTYRALSGILHLPETVLSRYVKGHVLPTAERAEEINKTLQKYMGLERELHKRIIIAKQNREIGVREFIEEVYVMPPAIMKSLYVSKDAFKKGEGILIADDIIDSGETQRAMIKVAYKAKAEVIGIYALVAIGNEWKSRIESVGNVPVEIGLSLVKMVA